MRDREIGWCRDNMMLDEMNRARSVGPNRIGSDRMGWDGSGAMRCDYRVILLPAHEDLLQTIYVLCEESSMMKCCIL
jgi:hypothetical protein